jgi:hypothetical protein
MVKIEDLIQRDRNNYTKKINAWSNGIPLKTKNKKNNNLIQKVIAGAILMGTLSGCPSVYEPYYEKPTPTEITEPTSTPIPEPTPTSTPLFKDYVDFSGNVEDNETHTGQRALIRVYNNANEDFLGEFSTDDYGNFSFSLEETVSELYDGVRLDTKLSDSNWENGESYIRRIELPSGDHNPTKSEKGFPAIRAVPYPNFDTNGDGVIDEVDYENFREHMKDTNISTTLIYNSDGSISEIGLHKFDLPNLEKIRIFKYNPNGKGSFADMEIIKNIVISEYGVEKYLDGMQLDDYVEIVEGCPPTFVNPNQIYIYPDDTIFEGRVSPRYLDGSTITGIVNGGRIRLNPTSSYMIGNINHELTHLFLAPEGESYSLPNSLTVMFPYVGGIEYPGEADIKSSKIVYEETYQPREKLDNILGMDY